ncbi:MAG TPA: sugar-binding protein, partial [Armatimonadota bacterium]|nr:sugar-binding protein [Armatimonadota bacterium]
MIRAMGAVLLVGCGWAQDAPGTLVRELSGVADAATADGEAKTLDKEGIYCWWVSPKIRPGYFQVIARARTTGAAGVLHFVLTDSADENRVSHAITETRAGRVTSEEYEEIYCGSFHWDGSYGARISDWSTPGLMVDWVKLVPVTAGEIRDPLPGALKQYEAPRFGGRTASDLEIRPTTADGDADVVIDGELGEWAGVPLLVLGAEEARSADYGGTGDLSATVAFAWNDTHLYFACEATDDSADFLQDGRKLSSIWQHDSIQLAFDAAGNAKTPGYADDDYEYGLGMTADGARVYRWVAGNNLPVGDVPTIDLAVTRDDEAGVTRYEAAIPFKELVPFSPERAQCGVTMVINDRDAGEGQRAWLEWTPGIAGAKDPSAFGILRLIDSPPATTAVTALLIARRDLSVDPDLDASLRVHSAEALGQCALQWRIAREGAVGEVLQRGERAVELEEAGAVIEIPSEATASGLKPLLQDDGTATASDQEIRPTIGGVDIAGLGEG